MINIQFYTTQSGEGELTVESDSHWQGYRRANIELTPAQGVELNKVLLPCVNNTAINIPDAASLLERLHEVWGIYQVYKFVEIEPQDEELIQFVDNALRDTQTKAELLIRGLKQAKEMMALFEELFGPEKAVAMMSLDYDKMVADVRRWTE